MNSAEIAEALGVPTDRASIWLHSPVVIEEIKRLLALAEQAVARPREYGRGPEAVKRLLGDRAEEIAGRHAALFDDDRWARLSDANKLSAIEKAYKAMGVGAGDNAGVVINITTEQIKRAESVFKDAIEAEFTVEDGDGVESGGS